MVVLPLSTTDSSCGTLHFTLTVIINSSTTTSSSNQKEKIRRLPNSIKHGPFDVAREDPIAQNSVYRSTKQPISVSSLSKSVNTTQMLPEYITNQNQLIHESGSFAVKKHIADENNKRNGKHLILKTSSKLNTPIYTRRKTSLEEESRMKIDSEKIKKSGDKHQRFRRLSSTELEAGCRNQLDDLSQHNRRSLRGTCSGTKPKVLQLKNGRGELYRKENSFVSHGIGSGCQKKERSKQNSSHISDEHQKTDCFNSQQSGSGVQKRTIQKPNASKSSPLVEISSKINQESCEQQRKMSAPTVSFSTNKMNHKKLSNFKIDNKPKNSMKIQNLENFNKNVGIQSHSTLQNISKSQITKNLKHFPVQQPVQRVSYILSVSSAASMQQCPRLHLAAKQPAKKPLNNANKNQKGNSLSTAVKRSGTDTKLDTQERLKTPSPNKRANTTLIDEKSIEEETNEKIKANANGNKKTIDSHVNDVMQMELEAVTNNNDDKMMFDDCQKEGTSKSVESDTLLMESEIFSIPTQNTSVPPHPPPRGNLRLHPAVLRKSPKKSQTRHPRLTLASSEQNKVLFRQSFPNGNKDQSLMLSTENSSSIKEKQLKKQNTLAQITVVSVTGGSCLNGPISGGESMQSSSIPELTNSPINPTRNHPLRRQYAIQSSTSIDTGSMINEGCTSNSNVFQLQNTLSIESVEGHIVHRRPRSLIHQSAGSLQGFSLFGSVDSEQSVPRTAPLATPEQELSLLEMASFENLPVDGIIHQGCMVHFGGNITLNAELRTSSIGNKRPSDLENQQSLDAISNDVFFNALPMSKNVPISVCNAEIQVTQVDDQIENNPEQRENDDKENVYQHKANQNIMSSSSSALDTGSIYMIENEAGARYAKSADNISLADTEKCSFLPTKYINTLCVDSVVQDNPVTLALIDSTSKNEVNFMDLSCSSSNQDSPESQTMEIETGIPSSDILGLASPTTLRTDGRYAKDKSSTSETLTLRESLETDAITKQNDKLKPKLYETISQTKQEIGLIEDSSGHSQTHHLDDDEDVKANIIFAHPTECYEACKNISMNKDAKRSKNSFGCTSNNNFMMIDDSWNHRKNVRQGRFHTPTTFNLEITPPPPSSSANECTFDRESNFLVAPANHSESSENTFTNMNPLPDVVPREKTPRQDAFSCIDDHCVQLDSSYRADQNEKSFRDEQDFEASSQYVPLTYSDSQTMAIPISSPSMIRSPQPLSPTSPNYLLTEVTNRSKSDACESPEDRVSTAFPFPSVRPLLKGKSSKGKSEIQHKGTKSYLSSVRAERHDSITSSSSSSYNDSSEITNAERMDNISGNDLQGKEFHSSSRQYHTREGYPKPLGSIRKLSSIVSRKNQKEPMLTDSEENKSPILTIKEVHDFSYTSDNIERNDYDDFLNYNRGGRTGNSQAISPTTPTSSDIPTSPVQITTLPSIPKRSTYRIELQPGEALPERM